MSGVKAGSLVGVLVTRFGLGNIQVVLGSYIPGLEQGTPVLVLGIFTGIGQSKATHTGENKLKYLINLYFNLKYKMF